MTKNGLTDKQDYSFFLSSSEEGELWPEQALSKGNVYPAQASFWPSIMGFLVKVYFISSSTQEKIRVADVSRG